VNITARDEDITFFSLDKSEKKFITGDYMGSIQTVNYNTGATMQKFSPHEKECFYVHVDSVNNLLSSAGLDNTVTIQKYSQENKQVLRRLKNPVGKEDV
jgi:WD40 repeat protein